MTIIEAIKSGKPFRRAEGKEHMLTMWYWFDTEEEFQDMALGYKHILATDWEVLVCEKHNHTSDIALDLNCGYCMTEYLDATQGPDEDEYEGCLTYTVGPLEFAVPELQKKFTEVTVTTQDETDNHRKPCETEEAMAEALTELCETDLKEVTVKIPDSWNKCKCGGDTKLYQGLKEEFKYCTKCGERQ